MINTLLTTVQIDIWIIHDQLITCFTVQSTPSGQPGSGIIRRNLLSGLLSLSSVFSLFLLFLFFFLCGWGSKGVSVTRIRGSCTTSRFCPDTLIIRPPLKNTERFTCLLSQPDPIFKAELTVLILTGSHILIEDQWGKYKWFWFMVDGFHF